MSKKNIIIAIIGGCIVGGLGVAIMIYPANGALLAGAAALVTAGVAAVTGFNIKPGA
ncbi:hypothetical protein CCP3SC15_150010 [Gammaproteobacteria bacterium]